MFFGQSRLETSIGWIFLAGFVLAIIALVIVSLNDGLNRRDRFEVIVISIDWLVLLVNGALLSQVFGRRLKQSESIAAN